MKHSSMGSAIGVLLGVFLAIAFALPSAQAARTWTGSGGDQNWFNPLNWDGGVSLPGNGDSVTITGPSVTVKVTNQTASQIGRASCRKRV